MKEHAELKTSTESVFASCMARRRIFACCREQGRAERDVIGGSKEEPHGGKEVGTHVRLRDACIVGCWFENNPRVGPGANQTEDCLRASKRKPPTNFTSRVRRSHAVT
jgi:hypothetical protein